MILPVTEIKKSNGLRAMGHRVLPHGRPFIVLDGHRLPQRDNATMDPDAQTCNTPCHVEAVDKSKFGKTVS